MEERSRTLSLHGLPLRIVQLVFVAAFLLMNCLPAMAQTGMKVKGVVKSGTDGEPLIGVNLVQKGTTNGTVTGLDGDFELTVPAGADVNVTYIGFLPQTVKIVAGKTTYDISLVEDTKSLEEVVVVGYGVQKKKLVTGATVQVAGDDIQKLSTTSVFTALQGQTPGVSISQVSGQPGADFKVNIRGIGTIGNSSPLYVIDGVAGGDLKHINSSDIESLDVLKDAASAAIYGSRGANGVILVTTKRGKSGKVQMTYDGYYGVQNVRKMPPLVTAQQYMALQDEMRFNENNSGRDWANELPGYLYDQIMDGSWTGTNWVDEFRNEDAITQNHSINLLGGSELSKFAMGFSYTNQEGIFGAPKPGHYTRYTGRMNSDHVLLKGKGYDIITVGENIFFNHHSTVGQGVGDIYWNDLHNMLIASPLMPVYAQDGGWYDQAAKNEEGWTVQGAASNPIYSYMTSSRSQNTGRNFGLRANAYIEIQPIKNLRFKSTFAYNRNSWTYRDYSPMRWLSSTSRTTYDAVSQSAGGGYDIAWINTLSYNYTLNQQHVFDALIGQEMLKSGMGEGVNASARNLLFPDQFEYAYIVNAKPTALDQVGYGGSPWGMGRMLSFFGRLSYNYKETYMATATLRADGSSKFARGNRWGYFPSVSAGWVITNEAFMESVRDSFLDFFKLRASWGQNGNNDISDFQYLATISMNTVNRYFFGTDKETSSTGAFADILPNKDITWETSEQTNIGFDARILNSRMGINFDWFQRDTKDWLVRAPQLASYGTGAPYINGGDVRNSGFELALTWNDNVGELYYGVNFNISKIKNEVTRIANTEKIIHGDGNQLSQGTTEIARVQEGYPISYFWGYKTEGIFQNQAQIDEYRAAGKGVLSTAQPGDVIFADLSGPDGVPDGSITEKDKTMIGDPNPDYEMGFSFNLGYKGFDFSASTNGKFGMQIAKSYRSFADGPLDQYTTEIFGRWTGEGTSNFLPRLTSGSHTNWQYLSEIWIEDADYLRVQNITLGYDFKKLFPKMPLGQARLYVSAQNPIVISGYSGMDPEVGTGLNRNWQRGIDVGFYPTPKTYLVGVNLKF